MIYNIIYFYLKKYIINIIMSGFYTHINGKAYNINNMLRGGGNSSSKDDYHHTGGQYFGGTSNNNSNLRNSTLINYNFGDGQYSIDSLKSTNFKHNNSNRPDLGNYFGANYSEHGPGSTNITVPEYCNRIVAICIGGGGGGGAARFGDNDGHSGAGGGSGGAVCGYIDCSAGQNIGISVGGGGGNGGCHGGNGGGGGHTTVSVGGNYIRALGGSGGAGQGGGGGGGGGYQIVGGSRILNTNGNRGAAGINADDDDDEMNSQWEGTRPAGGGSVYNWTNSGNASGWAGAGGHFGDDDEFDGDCGDPGGGGWCRVYYTRR